MAEKIDAPVLFFAPFVSSAMRVEPQWIDYNNHLNVAYYILLFDRAVDECFALLGIGEEYVRARRASLFTAEAHIGYRRELSVGESGAHDAAASRFRREASPLFHGDAPRA